MTLTSQPSPAATQQRPPMRRLTRIIGTIAALLGFFSAGTGVLQYFGVTQLPIISNFIHPGADQILGDAKAASFKDVSCSFDVSASFTGGSSPGSGQTTGTCLFTSSPQRSQYQLHIEQTGSSSRDQTIIYDVGDNAQYSKYFGDTYW